MIITYYGLSCFKLSTKTASGIENALITDVFDAKQAGLKPLRLKADVALSSNSASPLHNDLNTVKPAGDKEVFGIDKPGEYEVNDIYIQGLPSNDGTIVYYLEIEKLCVAFLGSAANTKLTSEQTELLEDCDILILPVGGGSLLDAKQASEVTKQLEPRIVIPAWYKAPGLKLKELKDSPENFFKELGVKHTDKADKLKVTTKDLPQEELQVTWLTF